MQDLTISNKQILIKLNLQKDNKDLENIKNLISNALNANYQSLDISFEVISCQRSYFKFWFFLSSRFWEENATY